MRDFDFHPGEPDVRTFDIPEAGVLVNDDDCCVTQTRQPDMFGPPGRDLVLRHYAFSDEWFKINATFDLSGLLIQPGPAEAPFAVNCDIATPMMRIGEDIAAVDLFLDVLIDKAGTYRLVDRAEFDHASAIGLISSHEARHAETGLKRLLHWIESGRLFDVLVEFPPERAASAPAARAFECTPLDLVPAVGPITRPTW